MHAGLVALSQKCQFSTKMKTNSSGNFAWQIVPTLSITGLEKDIFCSTNDVMSYTFSSFIWPANL